MTRRGMLVGLLGLVAAGAAAPVAGCTRRVRRAVRKHNRRRRRRVRRRVRRRHRRRVAWRTVGPRRVVVVPRAARPGWELQLDSRVVVVREVRADVVVIENPDGTVEELAAVQEDTAENGAPMRGSQLADDDTATPGVDAEEELEEEVGE